MVMDLLEGEVAVPIDGFPGYYVTNRGRVWSTRRNRWLKATHHYSYYYVVVLRKEGKGYSQKIHRLVGLHFLPIVNIKGALICHKNEELPYPEINFVENLWVGNHQQNGIDCEKKGRGQRGKVKSQDHKRKLSESKKGKKRAPFTEEHKRNMSKAWQKRREANQQKS